MLGGMRPWLPFSMVVLLALPASAGKREVEDLERQIATQRAGAGDLERLDDRRAVSDEIVMLRSWLDEATTQIQKGDLDKARSVLDRCLAQGELVRQKIAATRGTSQAVEKETALKRARERNEKTKAAIQQATVNKKALEMNSK
jgi:hypothetical protein